MIAIGRAPIAKYMANIRMRQAFESMRFAQKSIDNRLIAIVLRTQQLQRNNSPLPHVMRLIDIPHTTACDEIIDEITSVEQRADQRIDIYGMTYLRILIDKNTKMRTKTAS